MDIRTKTQQFSDFYEREVDALFRYTALRVGNREEVKDIVQETFSALWEKLARGGTIREERAFLYASARNKIIDWYRKKKSLSLEQMADGEEGETLPFDPIDTLAESRIVLSAEAHQVLTLIATLPISYRDAVYLRLVEEMVPQEIAQVLGITAGAVSVRITRGLALLREQLGLTQNKDHESI